MTDIVLYHGTTHRLRDQIKLQGLLPRRLSGSLPNPFGPKSRDDLVYLARREKADYYTSYATQFYGGHALLVEVRVDTSTLEPDEDSKMATWEESLAKNGTCATCNPIPQERIVNLVESGVTRWPHFYLRDPTYASRLDDLLRRGFPVDEMATLRKELDSRFEMQISVANNELWIASVEQLRPK